MAVPNCPPLTRAQQAAYRETVQHARDASGAKARDTSTGRRDRHDTHLFTRAGAPAHTRLLASHLPEPAGLRRVVDVHDRGRADLELVEVLLADLPHSRWFQKRLTEFCLTLMLLHG